MRAWIVALVVLGAVAPASAGRLDEEELPAPGFQDLGGGGNQTAYVCFTDDRLYGFCDPDVNVSQRRLGNVFNVYITPLEGNVTYRILVGGDALQLGNGESSRTITEPTKERFRVNQLRRTTLVVQLESGGETTELDYGRVRFRNMDAVANDAKDDKIDEFIEEQLKIFTERQYRWKLVQQGAVGLVAILLGAMAAVQFSRERQENEESRVIAT